MPNLRLLVISATLSSVLGLTACGGGGGYGGGNNPRVARGRANSSPPTLRIGWLARLPILTPPQGP